MSPTLLLVFDDEIVDTAKVRTTEPQLGTVTASPLMLRPNRNDKRSIHFVLSSIITSKVKVIITKDYYYFLRSGSMRR